MTKNWGNIFFVGPMGAGKSRIGSMLSEKLRRKFYDSDRELEAQCGVSIACIFEYEGEYGFRCRERELISQLTQPGPEPIVLSTGGGVVLDSENRRCLEEHGTVIYLQTTIDEQMRRIRKGTRPLLEVPEREKLKILNAKREPYYQEVANLTVQTQNKSTQKVLNEIIQALEETFGDE